MTGIDRRTLLRTIGGASAVAGVAGCLGGGDDEEPTAGVITGNGGLTTAQAAAGGQHPSTTTEPPAGVGSGPSTKPDSLPTRASLDLYAADSPLNRPIPDDAAVDPDSDGYVELIARTADEGGFVIELKQYSAPVYVADADIPRRTVTLACGPTWDMGVRAFEDVPIPAFAEPATDAVDGSPIPTGRCGQNAEPDNQMVVLDLDARCEFDFWQARVEDGAWVASWANSLDLDGPGIYEHGLSARGSGFSTLSGLIWPDELARGRIDHALVCSYPYPRAGGPVAPATESDGVSTKRYALPEGARLQLDPTLDLTDLPLTPAERTIATALQEYGMFLVDRGGGGAGGAATGGGGVSTEAVDPKSVVGNPYDGLLPDVDFPPLDAVPLDRLRVLELPPQNPNADDESAFVETGCGHMA